ncbi:carbohydrate-binding protein [Listeria booriae]|uniref:carbohydrate-binding protein n=1 Tax=Listeria booriae TaxID=1552123 RepID=UPI001624E06B|nr:carbohydrate-binding protein [Listeria booriae]MBC2321761.1 hypothetical protein [Listeria booriae]MCD2205747.1 carbohydrate-binding protein [Listeria booriae]
MKNNTKIKIALVTASAGLLLSSTGIGTSTPINVLAQTNTVSSQANSKVIALENGDFENPKFNTNHIGLDQKAVPGWNTTASDGRIELQRNGFPGTTAFSGTQWAELNANSNAALYQDIATTPGVKVRWQVAHKGRIGTDKAVVEFGAPNGKMVQQSEMKDGKWSWGVYKGEYIIPEGQTTTRFQFRAVSTANGNISVGNYLDDIQFGTQSILQLTGSFSINSIEVNQDVDYNLHIVNVGGMTAAKNQIIIKLPSHLTYTPGTIDTENIVTGTQKYNPSTQELTFEVKTLNRDATVDIKIPLKGASVASSVTPNTSATYNDQNFDDDTYLATGTNADSLTITPSTPANWSDWSPTKIYVAGDIVKYNNKYYTAKWWTLGDNPNESAVWQIMNEWIEEWHPLKGYNGGEKVLYEGKIYQAKWWIQGEQPGKSAIWILVQ